MKNEEIRSLSVEELKQQIESAEKAYSKLKFAHAVNPLENPMTLRAMRREIARFKTELRGRSISEVSEKVNAGDVNYDEMSKPGTFSTPFTKRRLKKLVAQVKNS